MLKKTITYLDFDGNERTEDLYFNMTKNELVELAYDMPDVMNETAGNPDDIDVEAAGAKLLEKLGGAGVMKFIKDLVFKAYGVKSEDGRRFIKDEQLSKEFTQTMAYDEFLMSLMENDGAAAEFVNGVIPAGLTQQAGKTLPLNK